MMRKLPSLFASLIALVLVIATFTTAASVHDSEFGEDVIF